MSIIPESEADLLNLQTVRVNFYEYAALALYTYHYATTFSQEVQVIWGRRFSAVTVLLILNRYLPFASLILRLSTGSPSSELKTHASCMAQYIWLIIALCIAQLTTGCLLALRVYAVWGQDWKCFASVFIIVLFDVIIGRICDYPWAVYSLSPLVWGCWSSPVPFVLPIYNQLEIAALATVLARDVLVLVLTWIRTIEIKKLAMGAKVQPRFTSLLLRDGTVYFSINLAIDVLAMIAFAVNMPVTLSAGLTTLESALQAMLLSHLMFDLREAYQAGPSAASTTLTFGAHHMSSVHFTANVVGNIGAPLAEEWFGDDSEDDEQRPTPVVCDDPFAFGLIEDETDGIEMTAP